MTMPAKGAIVNARSILDLTVPATRNGGVTGFLRPFADGVLCENEVLSGLLVGWQRRGGPKPPRR